MKSDLERRRKFFDFKSFLKNFEAALRFLRPSWFRFDTDSTAGTEWATVFPCFRIYT